MTQPPPQGKGAPILLVLIALLGAGIVYASVGDLVRGNSLGADAVTIEARVVDTRVMTSRKRGDSYELRYTFDVGGRTYSYTDATGRRDLWATLEEDAWRTARSRAVVEVQYLPSDPWNNRPIHLASSPIFGAVCGGLTGLTLMLPAILMIVGAIRRRSAPTP